jgi:hypothetical protein
VHRAGLVSGAIVSRRSREPLPLRVSILATATVFSRCFRSPPDPTKCKRPAMDGLSGMSGMSGMSATERPVGYGTLDKRSTHALVGVAVLRAAPQFAGFARLTPAFLLRRASSLA